jgi:high-affinity iron transporter
MLPTFVIGLREGLEASLIVGIIAAFLRKQGRLDLLRWVYAGVATAIVLCVGVGVALRVLSHDLPQRQQEGLETVVGVLAVGMVTYMVVWMRRHSRDLKGVLEGATADALSVGSERAGRALVAMAFLAVLREGFETVVFLLAAFNETGSGTSPVLGAIIGILVAVALGWGIYRGGVRLNLSKFFRVTGLVLVLVAAGLVMTALHTAHEAGWLNAGQRQTFDLSWLVRPGSVRASLLTGILGLQAQPVVIELAGWLVYLVPVAAYVGWPQGRRIPLRRVAWAAAGVAVVAAAVSGVLLAVAPAKPATHPTTADGQLSLQVVSMGTRSAVMRVPSTLTGMGVDVHLARVGTETVGGLAVDRYSGVTAAAQPRNEPRAMSDDAIARLSGGRLPLGLTASTHRIPVSYRASTTVTATVEPRTERIVEVSSASSVTVLAHAAFGTIPLSTAIDVSPTSRLPVSVVAVAVAAARRDLSVLDRRQDDRGGAVWLAAAAAVLLVVAVALMAASYRGSRRRVPTPVDGSTSGLVQHQVSLT